MKGERRRRGGFNEVICVRVGNGEERRAERDAMWIERGRE